ncbi:MAG: ECF transporter S component [Clostridia bacterium]|nr:ECF transporter S component [Clostridia bacterium]
MTHAERRNTLRRLTYSSLSAALIFCATFFIRVQIFSGYIHIGDGLVFLSAVFLPAPYAAAAAALGTGLADLCGGYPIYIPVTAAIRIISVLCFSRNPQNNKYINSRNIFSLVFSALLTCAGYFIFDATIIYGNTVSAIAGVPFNLIQSAAGAVLFITIGSAADRGRIPLPEL